MGFSLGHFLSGSRSPKRAIAYYVDPMHPQYTSSKPGIAPDCGMALVPVYVDQLGRPASHPVIPGAVTIDAATRRMYGIRLARAVRTAGGETIRVYGRVAPDDTRVYRVNVGTDGYVKETAGDAVGEQVRKNQRLAVIYSPDFLTLVGGYLSAEERTPGRELGGSQNIASAQARADRLRSVGMSDVQIDEISRSKKIPEDIYIVAPVDGFILSRNISPGLRFEHHTDFYTIADLRQVWINAEVFGDDARAFRPGAVARVTRSDTGETFNARVSDILPEVDPATRALRVRLIAQNPGFALRPEMYVTVEVPVSASSGITIPAEAVLDSGLSKRVFVAADDDSFVERAVKTGWTLQDRVQILDGLREGDTIVASGAFLIDSESRLEATASQPQKSGADKRRPD